VRSVSSISSSWSPPSPLADAPLATEARLVGIAIVTVGDVPTVNERRSRT
jgi:hypothetical protein